MQMDRNKYEFLNSLLDKEIEIAKNRSLSFTDSRNSFLTNVQKSNQSATKQNHLNSSQMNDQQLLIMNQQNDTFDNSTTNNSYHLNANTNNNNKSYNDISYDDSRYYFDKKRASDYIAQQSYQNNNIIQRGREQNIQNHQNNLFERNSNREQQGQPILSNQELGLSNYKNNFSSNNGQFENDSSLKQKQNDNFHLENQKQQYYGVDSSQKNNFENSITNYPKNNKNALQTSINQSSGFSPFDNSKYMRNGQQSPETINNQYQSNEVIKISQMSNAIAIQAQNQLEQMRRQLSQNSQSPNQQNSVSPQKNNPSPHSLQQNKQQQQQKLQELYQNYSKQFKQSQESNQAKSQQESYSLHQQYDSTLSSSEERKNQFQKEFESIQLKISALEDKLKITEEKNQQLAGISQENQQNSIVSLQNQINIEDVGGNSTFQNKRISDLSIFTNPTIKQNSHGNNQISPRFNIQESIFFQQQESQNKNNISPVNKNQTRSYQQKQNSSSSKKKKTKSSSRKSEPNSETDSGMKPKHFDTNESIENNNGKYLKKLEVQILNDSRDMKEDTNSKQKSIRFKTPISKKNPSLPPSSSHSNQILYPSSTSNIAAKQQQQQQPIIQKEENNMYSEELKALQKELQMWEYRRDKQHLQLQHMQDNNKRNSSKLSKLKKQSNKLVKIKKEQEFHLSEYEQMYHNFEKCELIRQKQKVLISCLKDELKLLSKKVNTKLIN